MLYPVHWRSLVVGVFTLFLGLLCASAHAAEPAYLKEMPASAAVIAQTTGSDTLDTQARRAATFARLIAIMKDMEGRREFNGQTPGEIRLINDYNGQINRIQTEVIASLPPGERVGSDSQRAKWFSKSWHYEADDGFQKSVMSTYFSPEFAKAHGYAHLDAVGRAARGGAEVMGKPADQVDAIGRYAMFIETVPPSLRFLFNRTTWITIFVLWFIAAVARELYPLALDSKQMFRMRVGGRTYDLQATVGEVVQVRRWTTSQVQQTTTTTTDAYGNTHTTHGFYTYYTHHVMVVLRDGAGRDHELEFTNQKIPLVQFQQVAAWYAIQKGKGWGPYIYFDVLSGKQQVYVHAFTELMRIRMWAAIPLMLGLFIMDFSLWALLGAFVGFLVMRFAARIGRELYFKASLRPRLDVQRRAENIRSVPEATVKTA